MKEWYIAKCKPQKEAALMSFLSQWEVQVFYPQVLESGRRGRQQQALFPSYLFCYLDPGSSIWPVARWAPGMAYFLASEGQPISVPPALVDGLRQRVHQWNSEGFSRGLAPGDKVMVLSGPFSCLEGIFQRWMPGRQRCQILLELMGRLTNIELPQWDVRAASQASNAPKLGVNPGS